MRIVEIDLEIIQYSKQSPVKLLRTVPMGRPKKNTILIVNGKIKNA